MRMTMQIGGFACSHKLAGLATGQLLPLAVVFEDITISLLLLMQSMAFSSESEEALERHAHVLPEAAE